MVRSASGMKRVDFYVSKVQVDEIRKLTKKTGLSASEILRRAIDQYLKEQKKK